MTHYVASPSVRLTFIYLILSGARWLAFPLFFMFPSRTFSTILCLVQPTLLSPPSLFLAFSLCLPPTSALLFLVRFCFFSSLWSYLILVILSSSVLFTRTNPYNTVTLILTFLSKGKNQVILLSSKLSFNGWPYSFLGVTDVWNILTRISDSCSMLSGTQPLTNRLLQ